MKLTVDILTPQSQVFSGEADEILVPTVNGELGILPNHVSILTQILPGELLVKNGGKTQSIAIMGGYLEVNANKVNVLGDFAIRAEDIESAKVEQAKAKAEKMKSEKLSQEEILQLETEIRRSILELKVANKRRSRN
jgi:F-type H+-transporting ATPase subunit epsilon